MLHLALTLLLPLGASPSPATPAPLAPVAAVTPPVTWVDDEEVEELDEDTVEAAVEALEAAFEKGVEVPERISAIQDAAAVPHEDVVRALKPGLKDDSQEVLLATMRVLGKMETVEDSLDELVTFYKKDRRLKKDEDLKAETLWCIAWRGSPETLDLLSDDLFTNTNRRVLTARIYGMGRCRTPEAVESLMDIMKSAGKKKVQPFMADLRLSLAVLTGADNGNDQNRWIQWWGDNKRDLHVPEKQPEIHKGLQRKWDNFWGTQRDARGDDEGRGRGERGGDDDPDA